MMTKLSSFRKVRILAKYASAAGAKAGLKATKKTLAELLEKAKADFFARGGKVKKLPPVEAPTGGVTAQPKGMRRGGGTHQRKRSAKGAARSGAIADAFGWRRSAKLKG
jgi:hypothetical protein